MELRWDHVVVWLMSFISIVTFLYFLSSWIAQGITYSDIQKHAQIEQCLDHYIPYQQCFDGIYYSGHF